MIASPLVVAVCGDAGGASAVAPVLQVLARDRRVRVRAFSYAQAGGVWSRAGLLHEPMPEVRLDGELDPWLQACAADALLLGTSVNAHMVECRAAAAACGRGVPTLAVLDFWSNYARRFQPAEGALAVWPSQLAIMDEQARRELIDAGCPGDRLVVTGQPAFDDLVALLDPAPEDPRACGVRTVLFLSQPLEAVYQAHPSMAHPGFTEKTVLPALIRTLDQLAAQRGVSIRLLVQPHPREDAGWLSSLRAAHIALEVVRPGHPRTLLGRADLVLGMNTVLLLEAAYMGVLVASLQPGRRGPDQLPLSRAGRCPVVLAEADLLPVLDELLFDEAARGRWRSSLAAARPPGGAARRVADLLYHLLPAGPAQESEGICRR